MNQFFPNVKSIAYEGPDSMNPMAFKWYNPTEVVAGKTMRELLRFGVAYWHTFRGTGSDPFGAGTMPHPWAHAADPVAAAEQTVHAAFEFFTKLGVDFYCFHDRDIAPEADTLQETNAILDRICGLAKKKQDETGVQLLWNTTNAFSHPRFANGASTNPDAAVFAYAASQIKKQLEIGKELGAKNYVFWGGREGYATLLNTDMKREQEHLARLLQMAVDYAKKIGFEAQFLIEPKPKEPTKHQYDFDSATVISFLKSHGLDKHFKLNVECNHATLAMHSFEHDLQVASMHGMLGSIDANQGDPMLGWDTDEFPHNILDAALAMRVVLAQGGIAPGGLNFDAKLRRESVDLDDLFIAHISGMDTFALGLKMAAKMAEDNFPEAFIRQRYASYDAGIGADIESGKATFETLEAYTLEHGEPEVRSGKQEMLEAMLNQYLWKVR
jgi:xylose isomerase